MRRVVLDTNVLASGLRSNAGASFAVLWLVARRSVRPLVTTALFLEYEAMLKRPEQIAAHGLSADHVGVLMSEFAALSEAVEVHFLWRPVLSDPRDEMVLEAAINGQADTLITHNVKDFSAAVGRFDVDITTPSSFLEWIRK